MTEQGQQDVRRGQGPWWRRIGQPGPRETQPLTARQWFLIAVVAAVASVVFYGVGVDVLGGIARLVAVVGAIGLVWRLLKDR